MPSISRLLLLVLAIAGALLLAACGGDDPQISTDGGSSNQAGNGVDRAFAAAMIPHHESAIEMAKIAQKRGQSDFVRGLADDIVKTQQAEIGTLRAAETELADAGVEAGDLGVAEHMMGMGGDVSELETADPFDRAFVDMMVPHHQGAITMAKVELEKGSHPELKQLAKAIIEAQQREIDEMNDFREREYGAPVPGSGGGHG